MDNPHSNIQELHDRINIQFDKFKEKFLNYLKVTNNSDISITVNSLSFLQYDVKYEIDRFMNQSVISQINNPRGAREEKMEYLIKLQTIFSNVACQVLSDEP